VTSYYRADPPGDAASPFKKKQPKKNRRKILLGFLDVIIILLLVFGVGYSLALNSQPKVIVNDTSFHPANDYQTVAANLFSQFKNRNKITFNEQAVETSLQKKFPEINAVQIELPFFNEQATLRLTIAKPSFEVNNRGTDYVVASNGVVVAKAVELRHIKNLLLVNDQSGFHAQVGHPVLSSSETAFINTVIAQCQHAKVPIASLVLPATAEELDLRTTDQPYFVKFFLGGNAMDETGQFLAARQHFKQTNQPPSQYLDVRVAGKIFYK
jgi:hypothetical protein